MKNLFLLSIALAIFCCNCFAAETDVLIVGGGASGTAAGVQASRLGARAMIIEETSWLGGMLTSAGVSAIDGNNKLPSGFFGEFRDSLITRYGSADALKTGWVSNILYEPSVGNSILKNIVSKEKKLTVYYNSRFIKATKTSYGWTVKISKAGKIQQIKTRRLIDATELGDVAKACGVKYDIGMEARSECGEDIAPLKSNDIIQDLTYVMILKDYGVDKTIVKPQGYDKSMFACSAQSANCKQIKEGQTVWTPEKMITYGKLPNGKYMINWPIDGNDYYANVIELSPKEREKALAKAKNFSLCFLYYMQTELGFSTLGLDETEFPTVDHLPFIPYYRESRRIHGLVRFNVNHVKNPFSQPEALYRTGIAVGDYPIDHHHKRYPDWEKLPELHFYPIPSYNVPLGALIPQNVDGLIVAEKSISVSNLLNGTTRLQPVVMQIGQAAGTLAAISVKNNLKISKTDVRQVQQVLLENRVYLMPYLDLPKSSPYFGVIQRIGATGILKGEGKNVGWSNETWFNIDKTVNVSELKTGLTEFEPNFSWSNSSEELTTKQAIELINLLAEFYHKKLIPTDQCETIWENMGLKDFDNERNITRLEFSVLLDKYIDPFGLKRIDMTGKYLN